MLYGVHCEKYYSLHEVERAMTLSCAMRMILPAYTLSAEIICCASQSTDVTKLIERGNDNVFFRQSFSIQKTGPLCSLVGKCMLTMRLNQAIFKKSINFCHRGNYQYKECLWLIFGDTSSKIGPVILWPW